ncbi:hypothetical protein TNCV_545971, partial [Trichonephila clavipes]
MPITRTLATGVILGMMSQNAKHSCSMVTMVIGTGWALCLPRLAKESQENPRSEGSTRAFSDGTPQVSPHIGSKVRHRWKLPLLRIGLRGTNSPPLILTRGSTAPASTDHKL